MFGIKEVGSLLNKLVESATSLQAGKNLTGRITDRYDWDQGKTVTIPLVGCINDEDARRVETAGRASSRLQWDSKVNQYYCL
jgi:hypothetical protein